LLTRPITRLLLLAILCGLAVTPFLRWGSPSGHDFEFHLHSWMDVHQQWAQGVVYPRWAALAQWGYGEARFLFYPPGSWTLGATLGAILPWKIVPAVYCWIVLTLAGASMYALARRWLDPPDALFAAAFYALNPYHLLIVYWRSAFAELLAAVVIPLVVLRLLRIKEDGVRPILWLSLALATAWLANAPAALMIHYSTAGLVAVMVLQERSARERARILFRSALAILLGAGLAAFYLVPAIYEQAWINAAALLSPGVRPQDNFLFTTMADVDHNRFNLLVSLVALSEIAFVVLVVWLARPRKKTENGRAGQWGNREVKQAASKVNKDQLDRSAWMLLASWAAAAAFVMLPVSDLLWQHLPKFRFVQLPFRWLLCLNPPLALLLSVATIRLASWRSAVVRWTARAIVSATLLATLLVAGHRIQPPWWDQSADIQEMDDAISDGVGYEGTDEYVPAGDDPYELNKDLPQVSVAGTAPANLQMLTWNATDKHFFVHAEAGENLTLRLFNYPAWKVIVNGRKIATRSSEVTGLMIIPVASGVSDVQIYFSRTPDRVAGDIVSLVSLAVLVALWIRKVPARRACP
jgi:hypothetical protein